MISSTDSTRIIYRACADDRLWFGQAGDSPAVGRGGTMTVCDVGTLRARLGSGSITSALRRQGVRISLPPDFAPSKISWAGRDRHLRGVLDGLCRRAIAALSQFVFWTLAQFCADLKWPFDDDWRAPRRLSQRSSGARISTMPSLVDSVSGPVQCISRVTFPVSVLASVTNQELTSYAWIFPTS
jgi:glucuronate isomerase